MSRIIGMRDWRLVLVVFAVVFVIAITTSFALYVGLQDVVVVKIINLISS